MKRSSFLRALVGLPAAMAGLAALPKPSKLDAAVVGFTPRNAVPTEGTGHTPADGRLYHRIVIERPRGSTGELTLHRCVGWHMSHSKHTVDTHFFEFPLESGATYYFRWSL